MRTPRPISLITTVVIVALGLGGMAITGLTEADDVGTSLRRAPRPEVAAAGREAADFLDEYVSAEAHAAKRVDLDYHVRFLPDEDQAEEIGRASCWERVRQSV